VHFGGQSAKKSGLLDRVYASLDAAGIPYVSLGGVKPNPRLSLVYEGIELCKREGVDFLLPVGGGSVIDSAKAIGYGLANDFDVWDLYDRKNTAKACAPLGAVLTIAAAGSEMSDSSVITKEEGGIKRGYNCDLCRCKFAVMNPELTYTLPAYQTACGAADIMMHVMERYFVTEDTLALTDGMAEALIRTVMENASIALKTGKLQGPGGNPVGQLPGVNGLMNGGPKGDWACHQLEHELGGMLTAHGAGLALGAAGPGTSAGRSPSAAQFAHRIFGIPARATPWRRPQRA
ncbi:MAG: iron-containing alcohol dehydrogenase, partial [Acutalibacter sp.]